MDIDYTSSPDGSNRLTARIDGEVNGWIEWAPAWDQYAPDEITGLSVVPKYRRQGIATALYDAACSYPGVNPPCHSPLRTLSGEGWAWSVGGELPALHNGRFLRAHGHTVVFRDRRSARTTDRGRPVRSVRVRGGLL